MYQYTIKLNFEVKRCEMCPFRHEEYINEPVESMDKLSGIVNISRRSSICILKEKTIKESEHVDRYDSTCPLKGNVTYVSDDK